MNLENHITALDIVMENYQDEFMQYIHQRSLPENETSAQEFLEIIEDSSNPYLENNHII